MFRKKTHKPLLHQIQKHLHIPYAHQHGCADLKRQTAHSGKSDRGKNGQTDGPAAQPGGAEDEPGRQRTQQHGQHKQGAEQVRIRAEGQVIHDPERQTGPGIAQQKTCRNAAQEGIRHLHRGENLGDIATAAQL